VCNSAENRVDFNSPSYLITCPIKMRRGDASNAKKILVHCEHCYLRDSLMEFYCNSVRGDHKAASKERLVNGHQGWVTGD